MSNLTLQWAMFGRNQMEESIDKGREIRKLRRHIATLEEKLRRAPKKPKTRYGFALL